MAQIDRMLAITNKFVRGWNLGIRDVFLWVANSALQGTAERAAEKYNKEKGFLQGLKPVMSEHLTSGLKPRPPKEKTFSAACSVVA